MDAVKFGLFVARARKDKNMTQAELAAKIKVTDKAVSRWERGLGFPDINTIEPLAEALGVSVLELMKSEKIETKDIQCEDLAERESVESVLASEGIVYKVLLDELTVTVLDEDSSRARLALGANNIPENDNFVE